METRVEKELPVNEYPPDQSNSLLVELGGQDCYLPWKRAGDAWIAYFDPRREELFEAGVTELVRMMDALGATTFVTPSSSKSEGMMQEACRRLKELKGTPIKLITFAKGEPEEMETQLATAAYNVNFSPITAAIKLRVMTATYDQAELLKSKLKSDPAGVAIIDDVISTGETVNAIRQIFYEIDNTLDVSKIRTLAVVKECVADEQGNMPDETSDNRTLYAVKTPVVLIPEDQRDNPQIPVGFTSKPFSDVDIRTYSPSDITHLKGLTHNRGVAESSRWAATLALSGHKNLSDQGLYFLANSH